MPELPEVEIVKRGLCQILGAADNQILKVETSSKKLRMGPSLEGLAQVEGERILGVRRKAKYLLFELEHYFLLSHLGMTGSWRVETEKRKHDHIRIHLSGERILTYHDARRFGMFDVLKKTEWRQDQRFVHLGLDPVSDSGFSGDYLFQISRNRKTTIKALIMNQEVLVGVGNIYASEALFLAGINPLKICCKLSRKQVNRLAESIGVVLREAIVCGGTTISDFQQAGGGSGYFQNFLLVYGRDKESCRFCKSMIQSQAIVGRNSFWCPKCQKL